MGPGEVDALLCACSSDHAGRCNPRALWGHSRAVEAPSVETAAGGHRRGDDHARRATVTLPDLSHHGTMRTTSSCRYWGRIGHAQR